MSENLPVPLSLPPSDPDPDLARKPTADTQRPLPCWLLRWKRAAMDSSLCTPPIHETESHIVRCSHNLRSQEFRYLEDSKDLGTCLAEFDSDFGAFDSAVVLERLELKRPRRLAFKFLDEDGALRTPTSSWSAVQGRVSNSQTPGGAEPVETSAPVGKKRRNRGRGGRKLVQRDHRGGGEGEDVWAHREWRLLWRALRTGQTCRTGAFSLLKDGSRTSTGWHGVNPPKLARAEIQRQFFSGEIKCHLSHFFPVPESGLAPALLVDCEDRLFAYRTSPAKWLQEASQEFLDAILGLVGQELQSDTARRRCADGERGPHLACILGHYRQYQTRPGLTAWHQKHHSAVEEFLNSDIIFRVIQWASKVVEMFFPGVASRFRECAEWHRAQYGVGPLFGLFFNLCINGIFPGQPRVFCAPHADSKNVVGVCALLIYQLPGKPFNHNQRSWIVLWEAGVVIELPPWVMFLYPSSLLYHFNVDVHDIKFVTTDGERPTPANSRPVQDGDEVGRGSLVFFNEASMYQASETGHGSLSAARAAGMSGATDYGSDVQNAFQTYGQMVDLRQAGESLGSSSGRHSSAVDKT